MIRNRGEWAEFAARLWLRKRIRPEWIHRTTKQHGPDIILADPSALNIDAAHEHPTFDTTHYLFLQDGRWGLVTTDDRFALPGVPHIDESEVEVKLRKRPSGRRANGARHEGWAYCHKATKLVYRDISGPPTAHEDLWKAIAEHIEKGSVLVIDVKLGHRSQLKNVNAKLNRGYDDEIQQTRPGTEEDASGGTTGQEYRLHD